MAHDLCLRRRLLRIWLLIEGKSALTKKELQAASRIVRELVRVFEARQTPSATTAALELRQRAFTLLTLAYDKTRAAIGYLRLHHVDADTIAPSLYVWTRVRQACPLPVQ